MLTSPPDRNDDRVQQQQQLLAKDGQASRKQVSFFENDDDDYDEVERLELHPHLIEPRGHRADPNINLADQVVSDREIVYSFLSHSLSMYICVYTTLAFFQN